MHDVRRTKQITANCGDQNYLRFREDARIVTGPLSIVTKIDQKNPSLTVERLAMYRAYLVGLLVNC